MFNELILLMFNGIFIYRSIMVYNTISLYTTIFHMRFCEMRVFFATVV